MNIDQIFSNGFNVITKRDIVNLKDTIISERELFNINPEHRHSLGMSNFHEESNKWENIPKIEDLKINEGKGWYVKNINIKRGTKTIKGTKKVYYSCEPKIGNKIASNWSLINILNKECPPSWKNIFHLSYKTFQRLNSFLKEEEKTYTIVPDKNYIFRAFELCPLSKVKIVILGKDPYPGENCANGISFSLHKGINISLSLKNIYKELKLEYPDYVIPNHGDLSSWTKQGILMINSALTTRLGTSGSHLKYWKEFIINTIKALNKLKPECIYILWGGPARQFKKYINNRELLLESRHPLPRSYGYGSKDNFIGNNHFIKVNELLKEQGEKIIDWNIN